VLTATWRVRHPSPNTDLSTESPAKPLKYRSSNTVHEYARDCNTSESNTPPYAKRDLERHTRRKQSKEELV
jgi:hypothetical protein